MINFFIFSFLFCFARPPTVWIEGRVESFDEKVITLRQKNGALVRAPRAAYTQKKGIQVGKDWLRIEVLPTDFFKMNPSKSDKRSKK